MDMMSDFDNLDVMLGIDNNNPIERELVDAIEQSLVHEDANTNTYTEMSTVISHMKMTL